MHDRHGPTTMLAALFGIAIAACSRPSGEHPSVPATATGDERSLALVPASPVLRATHEAAVEAPRVGPVVEVVAGLWFACARISSGHVACWGRNTHGELGNGTFESSPEPTWVSGVSDAVDLEAGTSHVCVVHRAGGVSCWGRNWWGETSPSSREPAVTRPTRVEGIESAAGVSAGHATTCAVSGAGKVKCWGEGLEAQLGDQGTRMDHGGPFDVPTARPADSVHVGHDTICAAGRDSRVECWGFGAADLGVDASAAASGRPVAIDLGFPVRGGDVSRGRACFVSDTGRLACVTGGTLESSISRPRRYPDAFSDIEVGTPTASVVFGEGISCVLDTAGAARCWGRLDSIRAPGAAGDQRIYRSDRLTSVGFEGEIRSVAPGPDFVCGLSGDGRVQCVGANAYGQLGDGSVVNRSSPVAVVGLP